MSIKVNNLDECREDPHCKTGSVYRVGFSRLGPPDTACPPESQTDQKETDPMTKYSKIALDGIFVSPATPSFADLMAQLETDTVLKPARRKDLMSGLRRVTVITLWNSSRG